MNGYGTVSFDWYTLGIRDTQTFTERGTGYLTKKLHYYKTIKINELFDRLQVFMLLSQIFDPFLMSVLIIKRYYCAGLCGNLTAFL